MNDDRYLVDNNALMEIKAQRIRSKFFRAWCSVTADVAWEAGDHSARETIESVVIDPSPELLLKIRDVMRAEQIGDTGLVDLYRNRGAADPGIVAAALLLTSQGAGQLLPDSWTVVTNDVAVRSRAEQLGVAWMAAAGLAALIDQSLEG
jgi:hypothetical protein